MLSQQIDPNYNWKSYSVWYPSEYRLLGWVKDNSNYWLGKQCGGEKQWPSAFLPMPLPEWTCQITKAYVNHIARVGPWSYLQISSLTWNCHKVEFAQSWCLFGFGSNLTRRESFPHYMSHKACLSQLNKTCKGQVFDFVSYTNYGHNRMAVKSCTQLCWWDP